MIRKRFFLNMMMLPFMAMAALSCTAGLDSTMGINESTVKIANTPDNACQESILLLASPGVTAEMIVDQVEGICSAERVFQDIEKGEDPGFRLDRWYKAFVAEGSQITAVAQNAAASAWIRTSNHIL